jgi:hypothetical protein
MIIKIHSTKNVAGGNQGSSSDLVNYLTKEDLEKEPLEREGFFNHSSDRINPSAVMQTIDSNKGRLSKEETKFFMLTVNPDKKELNHIQSSKEALKSYVQKLMDQYAEHFHRIYPDGQQIKGEDLVYFAKIETKRTYKFSDQKFQSIILHNKEVSTEILLLKSALHNLEKDPASAIAIDKNTLERRERNYGKHPKSSHRSRSSRKWKNHFGGRLDFKMVGRKKHARAGI